MSDTQGETWHKFEERWEYNGKIENAGWTIRTVEGEEASPPIATCYVEADADRIIADHNRALTGEQAIALLREIVPHVRRWVANLDYEYEAEDWLARYDVLTPIPAEGGQ